MDKIKHPLYDELYTKKFAPPRNVTPPSPSREEVYEAMIKITHSKRKRATPVCGMSAYYATEADMDMLFIVSGEVTVAVYMGNTVTTNETDLVYATDRDAAYAKFCKYYESQSTNFSQSVTVSDVHVKESLR